MRLSATALRVFLCASLPVGICANQATPRTAETGDLVRAESGYRVGPHDVLDISVWGHTELSGKFTVAADGTFSFPLIGAVKAADRSVADLRADVTMRLEEGFLRNPRVTVEVQQYASQRVFVIGEVRTPGAIPLNAEITLLEALARAGSLTEQAGGEIVILRSDSEQAAKAPLVAGQRGASELGRVNVQQLRRGVLVANVPLHNGDTVFVPRAEDVYVLGLVNNPGTYTLEPGLTVLRALSLAGGATALGSTGRIRIVRIVNGQKTENKAKLDDLLKPGDTVVVGARLF